MQALAKKLLGKVTRGVDHLHALLQHGDSHDSQQQQPAYAPPPTLQQQPQQAQTPTGDPDKGLPHVIQITCHSVSALPDDPSFGGFNHPGTLMGPGELAVLQQRASGASAAPATFAAAVQSLAADTPLDYAPHALRDVLVEWYDGPKIGHDALVEHDGKQVYQQALMWLVTRDERYARNAAGIIRAWATVNKTFAGRNAPLEAGWGVASLARAAELLKHTWPAGWRAADVEQPFIAWVNACILPALNSEALTRLPLANWHATVAEAKAALAVFTGNRQLWGDALALWTQTMDAYLRAPCGECGETSRDLFHSQFGLGGLIQLAEMAHHQGTGDLYSHNNSRLFNAMEFHAFITLGGCPPECCYPLKGVGFLPTGWEVGYNHYCGRMGWPMPQTAALLTKHRPEGYVFHWGAGSLTHADTAAELRARAQEQQQQQQQQRLAAC